MTKLLTLKEVMLDTFYKIPEGRAKLRMNLEPDTRGREIRAKKWSGRTYYPAIRLQYTKAKVVKYTGDMWLVAYGTGGWSDAYVPGEIIAKPWEYTREFNEVTRRKLDLVFPRDVLVTSKDDGRIYTFERNEFSPMDISGVEDYRRDTDEGARFDREVVDFLAERIEKALRETEQ